MCTSAVPELDVSLLTVLRVGWNSGTQIWVAGDPEKGTLPCVLSSKAHADLQGN